MAASSARHIAWAISISHQRLQAFIRRPTVETPIQPDEPFVGLEAQIVHVNLAFAQSLNPLEKLLLAMNFESVHVSLGSSGVFWQATPGARDAAW
ncbi:hypothetical protein PPGU19_093000 (plasmid) [Paraburkholderia sp. PGU19]|nr:hypothetical protein PPGU19_093000 [Paraburkholderia sp. PGU19]